MQRRAILATLCLLALAAAALAVRLPGLDKRPMHGDEANQAVKAAELLEDGTYDYDPQEHHGPTLYWLTLPSLWFGGADDLAGSHEAQYRIVPVLFGAGLILLLVLLLDGLGPGAAVLAGVLAVVSPALAYYSRYYIQETLLVFFTLAAIACGWRYARSGRAAWAVAAGACVGLMHATKETWILAGAAMVAALPATIVWTRWRDGTTPAWRSALRVPAILGAAAAGCLVAVAFYSSFGSNWRGPIDSVLAYGTYFDRGTDAGIHEHPWWYYLQLLVYNRPAQSLFFSEGFIVGLAAVGAVFALVSPLPQAGEGSGVGAACRKNAASEREAAGDARPLNSGLLLVRFLVFYTLVLTALYSAIPYKTPWCMLSFFQGMTLLAGFGAWSMLRTVPTWPLKLIVAALLVAGTVHLVKQGNMLNTRLAADQRNPYVYAHTSSDTLSLAAQIERLAAVSPEGHEMQIQVVIPENYWPLPWYLRRFDRDRVGYWQDPAQWARDAAEAPPPSILIFTPDVQPQVDAHLRADYNQQMMYGLRPEVFLHVYAREDLWDAFIEKASK